MNMNKTKIALGLITLANFATYAMSIRLFGLYIVPVTDEIESFIEHSSSPVILGDDKDEWGCVTSAGYSWCNHTNACVSVGDGCSPYPVVKDIIMGADRDDWGCITSAGYTWCNQTAKCLPMNEVCTDLISQN
jgi:hypothetical protein